ncbi:hypothetical protein DH2020_012932 [Rehmannia glutinosa]|uniref:NB-ARC domain-containing protein n=1 Tax=Rehmannia glutinosa TaxID=99300 RepID=A0ABR0X0S2_REHGL
MAGVGKTTVAEEFFEYSSILNWFDHRAWVTVGPKYQLIDIMQNILDRVNPYNNGKMLIKGDELALCLRRILKDKRCLIVLDDVWNKEITFYVKDMILYACFGTTDSRIDIQMLKLRFMTKEESWDLLREKVLGENSCPPKLEKAGKKIAENCKGRPLTIVTVTDFLIKAKKTLEYWNMVAEKENSIFIDAYGQMSKDLVGKSLVLVRKRNYKYKAKTYGLHSALWHSCIGEGERNMFFHVFNNFAHSLVAESIRNQRQLCTHNNILFGIKDVQKSMASISIARSLLCTGPYHQYPVPLCFVLRLLRVVDALTIRFYEFPMEVLELVQLKYLALTCDGNLHVSIYKLLNLQILIVHRYFSIVKLYEDESYMPMEIWDMKELEHLQVMGGNLLDPCDGALLPNLVTLLHSEVVAPLASSSLLPKSLKNLSLNGLGFPWEDIKVIASLPKLEMVDYFLEEAKQIAGAFEA